MRANIRAAIQEISAAVDAEGGLPQYATNYEDMLDVIDDSGRIDLEAEAAKALQQLDPATEIAAIDANITNLKLKRAAKVTLAETAEEGDDGVNQLTKLSILKLLVPPLVAIVKCEQLGRRLLQSGQPPETKFESGYVEAMRDMFSNTRSFEATQVGTLARTMANFKVWKNRSCVQLQCLTASMYQELRAEATKIQDMLFDLDRLCKPANADECIETLRNWGGNRDLMKLLKNFQGVSGRGLKHFETMTSTLGCAGIKTPGSETKEMEGVVLTLAPGEEGQPANKTYEQLHQEFLKIRQSGRLQLSLRSASIIIHAKDAAAVGGFEKDVKPLKVVIPKAIKDKLAALNKSK